jgi:parvulin-like peptidyl-prolyl isomerase
MENTYTPRSDTTPREKESYVSLKFKKPKRSIIVALVVVAILIGASVFARGIFIAATVNGSPISRWSVIKELEKQGGKQVVESLISKKLIEAELNKQKISVTKEVIDAEIKKIETQLSSQGQNLKDALATQGMTEQKLQEQITIQKKLEALLADKTAVTVAEIDAYIKTSKATPPKDVKMEDFRKQISAQLQQQKFQQEAEKWVSELTKNAKIKYYVTY